MIFRKWSIKNHYIKNIKILYVSIFIIDWVIILSMENILNRFIRYAKIDTQSDETSNTIPSTLKQLDLLNLLVDELKEYGLEVTLDEYSRIYAHAKGNENYPTIALSSHVDTAPDYSGTNVNPLLVTNYDLSPIKLGNTNLVLDPDEFPILKTLKGKTLLTTDGTTLLGADDKAGVAIIMHFINEYLISNALGMSRDEYANMQSDYVESIDSFLE